MSKNRDNSIIYEDLRRRYATFGNVPMRKEVLEILKLRFTPEEAGLAMYLAPPGKTIEQLVQESGKGETEARRLVEGMTAKGILRVLKHPQSGQDVFVLFGFDYSINTPMYGDGIMTDAKLRVSELREKLIELGWNYGQFGLDSKMPGWRVLPLERHIGASERVEDWERASFYVNSARTLCVVACGCRAAVGKCKHPLFSCLHMDDDAEYWIKHRGARPISKEECLRIIEDVAREHSLITARGNNRAQPPMLCTCCSCCCNFVRPIMENHHPYALAKSNFQPERDREKCHACFTCQKACPVGAIQRHLSHEEGVRDEPLLIAEQCIGCGICSVACPRQAITLKRVRDVVPPATQRDAGLERVAARIW